MSKSGQIVSQLVIAAAIIVGVLTLGVVVSGVQAQSARNLPEAKYTGGGPDACLRCHGSPKMTLMADTAHGDADNPHTPYGQESCESCHGPGSFHVSSARGGIGFPLLNDFSHVGRPQEGQFDTCLGCHARTSGDRLGIGWVGSIHDVSGMTCSSCHEVHAAENVLDDVEQQQNLCARCHGSNNSEHEGFEQNGIRLERLKCSTCHGPHDL
ncbi:MAG: cytochrome c3 family protein [Geminicoccaceae bacterium]